MPEAFCDQEAIRVLATSVARSREAARRLGMPFASRLLDMCLVEIAMVWQGRDAKTPAVPGKGLFDSTLEVKLRLAVAECDVEEEWMKP